MLGSGAPAWTQSALQVTRAAVLAFGLELAFVASTSFGLIAGSWELEWGTLWLAPFALVGLGLALSCSSLAVAVIVRERRQARLWLAVHFALFAALVGYGLTTGRHFELWWRRAGTIGVGVGASAWLAYQCTGRLVQLVVARPKTARVLLAFVVVLLEALNRWLLVRLYPAFHLGLGFLALGALLLLMNIGAAPRAGSPGASKRRGPSWGQLVLVACGWLVCAALVPPTLQRLARFDNFRLVLLERAPVLGQIVRAASWLSPPPALDDESTAEAAAGFGSNDAAGAAGAGPAFVGRDLLLITLDALRADHLGCYGYQRATSAAIDRLAAQGVRFEWAYASTPHTSYSVTSLMTGKYMRPLLMQGAGLDSETLAELLRSYGYRTAAFYPPAIFFIDQQRFARFEDSNLGFEYQKKEFLEGQGRVDQVQEYLAGEQNSGHKHFVWVHLFGPHEPYLEHPEFHFGDRDVDRYDSEIAAADSTVGQIVERFRTQSPDGIVIVTADHGEEFGEHGGRYHGSSVYEEQVRVPLLISAPGLLERGVVREPVQSIDLMPTVLHALDIPIRPRVRGRDLGALLLAAASGQAPGPGFAYAETDDQSLLASGSERLICERKIGACRLFDIREDPAERVDIAAKRPAEVERLRSRLHGLNASHGQFEQQGLRAEGRGWPAAIQRGLAGDGDAALEIAELLDDADRPVREKAAELLFTLRRPETAAALRLALHRDESPRVQRFAALGLTRLGQGASLAEELLKDPEVFWRRRAALAFAEIGDKRGQSELIAWWQSKERSYEESRDLLGAFARLRSQDAVWALTNSLSDVRLRPFIAASLAKIGDDDARGALANALADEPYQTARVALARALLDLGAETELVLPLRRWLGVPDPLEGGLDLATRAGILEHVGGPDSKDLKRVRENAELGELVRVIVPKTGNGRGVRLIVRAKNTTSEPRTVWIGVPKGVFSYDAEGKLKRSRKLPEIHPEDRVAIVFGAGNAPNLADNQAVAAADQNALNAPAGAGAEPAGPALELHVLAPAELGLEPGHASYLVVVAERGLQIESLAAVPLQDEPGLTPAPKNPTVQHAPERRTPDPSASEDTPASAPAAPSARPSEAQTTPISP
ncbi:MAG TPA: sulfatase-like hydrolase/transferase [Polyangiaceae bacterium]|nr:sulfatase-like hydrolase/transferase [Polyangiaceae bacterium]